MNWTVPGDLRNQLQRLWDSGRLLSAPLRGEQLFPLRLNLRAPNARSLSEQFDDVRSWIREWETGAGYQLEWSEINHRILGRNRIPAAASVATEDDALRMIGKTHEAERFREIAAQTRERLPQQQTGSPANPWPRSIAPRTGRAFSTYWSGSALMHAAGSICGKSIFPAWIRSSSKSASLC